MFVVRRFVGSLINKKSTHAALTNKGMRPQSQPAQPNPTHTDLFELKCWGDKYSATRTKIRRHGYYCVTDAALKQCNDATNKVPQSFHP